MKMSMRLLVSILTMAISSSAFAAGNSDSKSLPVKAKVIAALHLTKTADLDFGDGYVGDAAFVVNPGDTGSAGFSVTGEKSKVFSVSFSAESVTLLRAGGTAGNAPDEVSVGTFTHDAGGSPALDGSGAKDFSVGATRADLIGKTPGDYAGSVTVTIAY